MIPLPSPSPSEKAWASEILRSSLPLWSFVAGAPSLRPALAHISIHDYYGDGRKGDGAHRGVDLWRDTPENRRDLATLDASKKSAPNASAQTVAQGIDVSHFSDVDWSSVVGLSFVIAKATEGMTITDDKYVSHVKGARARGIRVGAYHFFRASSDPVAQIRRFLEVAGPTDLPPALDVEWQSTHDPLGGLDAPSFASHVLYSVRELADLSGKRPLLYAAPGFWSLLPVATCREIASLTDLWLADYTPPADHVEGWDRYALWQYSGSGTIPGLHPKRGDLNRCDFSAWLDGAPLPAPGVDLGTTRGVQHALNLLGNYLVEDGITGTATTTAVIAFQRMSGLTPDGIVGPLTRAALAAAIA